MESSVLFLIGFCVGFCFCLVICIILDAKLNDRYERIEEKKEQEAGRVKFNKELARLLKKHNERLEIK